MTGHWEQLSDICKAFLSSRAYKNQFSINLTVRIEDGFANHKNVNLALVNSGV
jgi:hypothetical protein